MVARDVPQWREQARPARFDLVGLHWQGSGVGLVPALGACTGGWSRWRDAAAEDDGPMPAHTSCGRAAGELGSPYWTGPSNRIAGEDVRAASPGCAPTTCGAPARLEPWRAVTVADSPLILSRASWGANERIRRGRPRYADTLRFAVVHHTAGSNSYTRAQSAAIVRGIQRYHVLANGWDDIGYNFLVDKYGQIFEGRYGGVDRNVVGAHAQGFNTGSSGVALIGNVRGHVRLTAAARSALARLLAWRLDVAHVDPLSTIQLALDRQPALPDGPEPHAAHDLRPPRHGLHRPAPEAGSTASCPRSRETVSQTGAPKLYFPAATGAPGRLRALHGDAHRAAPVVGAGLRAGAGTSSRPGRGSAPTWTGRGTRGRSRPGAITTRSTPARRSGRRPVSSPAPPPRPRSQRSRDPRSSLPTATAARDSTVVSAIACARPLS